MKHGRWTILGIAAVAVLGAVVAGCGGSSSSSSSKVSDLPASSCPSASLKGPDGKADYLIASDLPLQGASRPQTEQMGKAIEFVLKQRGFKAGDKAIAYQACDDATAQAASWDAAKCTANANAYVANKALIGVIGTFNSGCAKLEIPILNAAPVAMVSPANTYVGLTQGGPVEAGEPDKYYPTGKRNYARVVAADNFQGPALAVFAQTDLKLKKVFILNDGQLYGAGLANNFRDAAKKLNLGVAGFQKWDAKSTSFEPLGNTIKATGADGVFLAGIVDNAGGKLVKDLRAVLGPNVQILSPDGFTPVESVIKDAGKAAEGVYVSVAGPPVDQLTGKGKQFVTDFGATVGGPDKVQVYSAYAAQAAEVLLDAIAASDGTRQSVVDNLFKTNVTDGIMGSFGLDANGDTTAGGVTMYQIKGGKQVTVKVVTPDAALVGKG
jgi:branched-chain amino acid transport system substrate-binding protein